MMRRALVLWIALMAMGCASRTPRSVLIISIDGMRPDYLTNADTHGVKAPYLRQLMREGTYASHVHGVLPTSTYPSHTTMMTGVWPATHGIVSNKPFEPTPKNPDTWYWYSQDILVPTLWETAAGRGMVTGSVSWPVSVGARGVRYNIPEFADDRTSSDLKMIKALAGLELMDELAAKAGRYTNDVAEAIPRDWVRTKYTVELIRQKKVRFMTAHVAALDHIEHDEGPFSPDAVACLNETDGMVKMMADAMREADPNAVICIVSDHGFSPVDRTFKLDAAMVKAGLITLKGAGETVRDAGVADWIALAWHSGGSAAIVMKDSSDAATKAKVKAALDAMAADPANGIARIIDKAGIAKRGAAPKAEFWVDMKPGFMISSSLKGDLVTKVKHQGTHGYSPEHAELDSFFLVAGNGVKAGNDLGAIDMRSIAPTVAKLIDAPLPTAELPALNVYNRSDQ